MFFIQHAIKFPDLVHATKMEPDRGFSQAATSHDSLIADGSDKNIIDAIEKAILAAGAKLKLIGLSINQIRLSEDWFVKADGQLAGTPSVLFYAIAVVLTHDAAMN